MRNNLILLIYLSSKKRHNVKTNVAWDHSHSISVLLIIMSVEFLDFPREIVKIYTYSHIRNNFFFKLLFFKSSHTSSAWLLSPYGVNKVKYKYFYGWGRMIRFRDCWKRLDGYKDPSRHEKDHFPLVSRYFGGTSSYFDCGGSNLNGCRRNYSWREGK